MTRSLFVFVFFSLLVTCPALAQTVRIQGQEVTCQVVDGKQMVRAQDLKDAFPAYAQKEGWVSLEKLASSPNARVVRRNGQIVSVRYYDRAMQAMYGESKPKAEAQDGGQPAQAQTVSYRDIMTEILRLSNIERAKYGAPPLTTDPVLDKAATEHSEEMAQLNYFSHTSPTAGLETPSQRMAQAGASLRANAENIAFFEGYPESTLAAKAVDGWMHSEGHRKNLLNPIYTHLGVGVGKAGNRYYLTQNFGTY